MLVPFPRIKTSYFTCHPRKTGLSFSILPGLDAWWPSQFGHKHTLSLIPKNITLLKSDMKSSASLELSLQRLFKAVRLGVIQKMYCFARCQVLQGSVLFPEAGEWAGPKGAKDIIKHKSIYITAHSTPPSHSMLLWIQASVPTTASKDLYDLDHDPFLISSFSFSYYYSFHSVHRHSAVPLAWKSMASAWKLEPILTALTAGCYHITALPVAEQEILS